VQINGRKYLVPLKAKVSKPADVPKATLPLDDVFDALRTSRAASKIVVLDACRNNPFAVPGDDASLWVPGLARSTNAPAGTIILFAADPDQVTPEHSTFTPSLLYYLPEPGLEVRDLFVEVRKTVRAATQGLQTPWEDGSPGGRFFFRAPAYLIGRITKGDDEVLVLLNGEEAMSWNSGGSAEKVLPLHVGDNHLVVKVFNQKTNQGGCNWARDILKSLGIDPQGVQEPEGWNYEMSVRLPSSTAPLRAFKGEEDPPVEKHRGQMFTVARATFRLDRDGNVQLTEEEPEVWRRE
jgi:hypothetical protein